MPDPDEQKEINDILWRACDTFRGTVNHPDDEGHVLASVSVQRVLGGTVR